MTRPAIDLIFDAATLVSATPERIVTRAGPYLSRRAGITTSRSRRLVNQ